LKQVFFSILRKEWITTIRYPMNFISSLVSIYLIFFLIFIGYKTVGGGGPNFGQNLESIIVGFFLWTFAIAAYARLSWGLTSESTTGTLEQLYMSPVGFHWISVFIVISDFLISSLLEIPILFLMMLTTGKWLHIDVITLLILFIPTIGSVYGIGFISGGIALVYKRIQSFFQVLQFLFVILIMIPAHETTIAKFLPLSFGTYLIHESMTQAVPFYRMNPADLAILYTNFLFYFFLGLWIFTRFEYYARKKGVLGHY